MVDGTIDPFPAAVYGVAGDHRRLRIPMPKEFLNHVEVIIIFQRVCDEGIPQCVSVGRPLTPSSLAMWQRSDYHNRRCVVERLRGRALCSRAYLPSHTDSKLTLSPRKKT
jgi:hypothetical protein